MLRLFKGTKHFKIWQNIRALEEKQNKDRISISESFKKYVKEIIPKYEVDIEVRMLNAIYQKMPTQALKNQVVNAYKRRQLDMHFRAEEAQIIISKTKQPPRPSLSDVNPYGKRIELTNYSEVGLLYDFGLDDFARYFPRMNFGQNEFVENNLKFSMRFCIQMTPEAFSVINILKLQDKLNGVSLDEFEPFELLNFVQSKRDLDLIFKDREFFLKIVFTLSEELRTSLKPHRFNERLQAMFSNSFMADYLVMTLAWQLFRPEVREILLNSDRRKTAIDNLIGQILQHPENYYFVPYDFTSFIEIMKQFYLDDKVKVDLSTIGNDYKTMPTAQQGYMIPNFVGLNSNILLWGVHGSGKSGSLYAVTMWAIKSNWLVFKVPSVRAITHSKLDHLTRHDKTRLFLNPDLAVEILKDFFSTNEHLLENIEVDKSIYGKYNMIGVHRDEPNPVPNFYIEDRQTYFYESDKVFDETECETIRKHQIEYDSILGEKLPDPKTLAAIAKYGIENPTFATNCLAELLEQAYNLESHNVLVSIDDYNWLYRPSDTPAFMYDNIKGLNGRVPPYHIALCRLFMKFDGHQIRRGFKIGATSNYSIVKHYFEPKKINFPNEFGVQLHGVDQKHLNHLVRFATESDLEYNGFEEEHFIRQLWMETQGNYGRLIRTMHYPEYRSF
jgi:small subunit ribosomal protein S29